MRKNDPFGEACYSYLNGHRGLEINVFCNRTEQDVMLVDYLFRSFEEMPEIEQLALKQCYGKVLVVGAGAGCHSLWLQDKGLEVASIDVSEGAVEVMKQFGLKNVYLKDFYSLADSNKYDTVISLMNGVGIAGDLDGLPLFLSKCANLINDNGQILLDSTDLKSLIEAEDVEYNRSSEYLGELEYQMSFEAAETGWFKWLYVDIQKLQEITKKQHLTTKILLEGADFNYLMKITK